MVQSFIFWVINRYIAQIVFEYDFSNIHRRVAMAVKNVEADNLLKNITLNESLKDSSTLIQSEPKVSSYIIISGFFFCI